MLLVFAHNPDLPAGAVVNLRDDLQELDAERPFGAVQVIREVKISDVRLALPGADRQTPAVSLPEEPRLASKMPIPLFRSSTSCAAAADRSSISTASG